MTNLAIFAAGCFWGIEEKFLSQPGVLDTEVGYIGGITKNPNYHDVCNGDTEHAEAVRVKFDTQATSYENLLKLFLRYMTLQLLTAKVLISGRNIDLKFFV